MAAMKAAPLTAEQEALFDASIRKYQTRLNLLNWRIERGTGRADKGNMAQVAVSLPDRLAVYKTGAWNDPSPANIDATARHELLHVLLSPYKAACQLQGAPDDLVMSEEHAIVVFLERLLAE